jgi:hypothetical protein
MTRTSTLWTAGAIALGVAFAACGPGADAQSGGRPVPYKLGTFERNNQPFVGLVLRDTQVVDIAQANAAWEGRNASAPKMTAPGDMKQLIAGYDTGWKDRLAAIASAEAAAASAPAYSFAMDSLRILPPVMPSLLLNAGGNYAEHSQGIAEQQQRAAGAAAPPPPPPAAETAPGIWERKAGDTRENPYLDWRARPRWAHCRRRLPRPRPPGPRRRCRSPAAPIRAPSDGAPPPGGWPRARPDRR